MAWKALIKSKSEVNVNGEMEITFDVVQNKDVVFPNITINTNADNYVKDVEEKANALRAVSLQAKAIKIGEEIVLKEVL